MDEIYQTLTEIYPEVDIDRLFIDQPDKSLAWYADYVVNNLDSVRKREVQRVPSASSFDSDDGSNIPLVDHVKLRNELITEFIGLAQKDLETPMRSKRANPRFSIIFRRLFVQLSKPCQEYILKFTAFRRTSSFIIALFVKNGLLESLIKVIPLPLVGFWATTELNPDVAVLDNIPLLCQQYKAMKEVVNVMRLRYSSIINANTLCLTTPALTNKTFNCGVCFDDASVDTAIACGTEELFNNDNVVISSDPCSSTDVTPSRPMQHKFCIDCVHRHAAAATESMPISECGTGLKCMEHGCKQPLLFSRVRHVLPKKTISMLENRVLAENLAAFDDIEKCPKCSFAVVMEVPKVEDKVFRCLKCKTNWCRLCELPWNDDHFGRSCDETAIKTGIDKKKRDLERKANEAVMRKCHRCHLPFTKSDGCNKVTCRCGATQCYICRTINIDYSHFCRHPTVPNQARTCCQNCLLWDDSNTVDRQAIEKVYEEAGEAPPEDEPPTKRFHVDEAMPQNQPLAQFAQIFMPLPFHNEAFVRRRWVNQLAQVRHRQEHHRRRNEVQANLQVQIEHNVDDHNYWPQPLIENPPAFPPQNVELNNQHQGQFQEFPDLHRPDAVFVDEMGPLAPLPHPQLVINPPYQQQHQPLPPLPQPPVHDPPAGDYNFPNDDQPRYQLPPLPPWPPMMVPQHPPPPQPLQIRLLKRHAGPPNPPARGNADLNYQAPQRPLVMQPPFQFRPRVQNQANNVFYFGGGGYNN